MELVQLVKDVLNVHAAEADPEMTIDTVREQLSSIKGNLADTIIKGREERV